MQLKRLNFSPNYDDIQQLSAYGKISCLLPKKVFYIFWGRNAWHSTWIQRYTDGCIHTTWSSAIDYAERHRVNGTVFYISAIPAIEIHMEKAKLLLVQMNEQNGFNSFSFYPNAECKNDIEYENAEICLNKILDDKLVGLLHALYPNNWFNLSHCFWRRIPSKENEIIILDMPVSEITLNLKKDEVLNFYKSKISQGEIKWSRKEPIKTSSSVFRIYKEYLDIHKKRQDINFGFFESLNKKYFIVSILDKYFLSTEEDYEYYHSIYVKEEDVECLKMMEEGDIVLFYIESKGGLYAYSKISDNDLLSDNDMYEREIDDNRFFNKIINYTEIEKIIGRDIDIEKLVFEITKNEYIKVLNFIYDW